MNAPRLAISAVAAWIADLAYGHFVYWFVMPSLASYPVFFQPQEQISLFAVLPARLLGFFLFAYMFAKGYEGGSGAQEGLRFGVLIGLVLVCFALVWDYATMPLSARFLGARTVTTLLEMVLAGVVVGITYKPVRVHPQR